MEYRWYLEGLMALAQADRSAAHEKFSRAATLNGKFWPALFQEGLAYRDDGDGRNAQKAFLSCARALDSYIQRQESCYNFLMEQFSPDYFLELCNSYIRQEEGR